LAIDSARAFDAVSDDFLKAVLIFMLMINVVTSLKRLRTLLVLATICGTFVAWGSTQGFLIGGNLIEGYRAQGIVGGMFGNPNDLALALNMFIPLALGLALTQPNIVLKLLYFGCAGAMVTAVFVTYSRGGFLALLAVGGYMLLRPRRRDRTLTILVVGAGILGILFAPEGYGIRVASIFDTTLDPVGSADARWNLMTRGVEALGVNPKRWLFGVGANNFSIVSIHDAVNHNAYLQVLTELGLPALVLYLMFLVSVLRSTGRMVRTSHPSGESNAVSMIAMAIQGSLVAYVVGSFFASVAYQWYLYYAAAYAICLRQITAADGLTSTGPRQHKGQSDHEGLS
jgi:O-antigen ligase